MDRGRKHREIAFRGKYRKLYAHLRDLGAHEWRTSFNEIEEILGFNLPPSARRHRPWWANQRLGRGHNGEGEAFTLGERQVPAALLERSA